MDIAIVIVSKGRETLKETLDSILKQTLHPVEVIINFQWEQGANFQRLNRCISQSKCEAFIPLCDDDLLAPTFIEETSALLTDNTECVYTGLQNFGDENGIHMPGKHPFFSSLYSKKVWEELGGYDEDSGQYADALFGINVLKRGRAKFIPKPLYLYRCHADQETKFLGPEEWDKIKDKFI
jgi:hypothetical protein